MSKQRTVSNQRTTGKTAVGKSASKQRRQAARRQAKAKPVRSRTGWAGMRRSRRQHLAIAATAVAALAVIWLFADWQLAIGLSALVLLVLPAFVVLTMGRRY